MHRNGNGLREKPIGELLSQLASDTGTLVQQEIELAKAELGQEARAIRRDVDEVVALGRREGGGNLQYAKQELSYRAGRAGSGAGMYGAAGAAALLGLGALTACLVLVLNRWLPADVAALVVGVAWLLVAAAAALRGRDRLREARGFQIGRYLPRQTIAATKRLGERLGDVKQLVPEQTLETVKEDVEWAKHPTTSGAR